MKWLQTTRCQKFRFWFSNNACRFLFKKVRFHMEAFRLEGTTCVPRNQMLSKPLPSTTSECLVSKSFLGYSVSRNHFVHSNIRRRSDFPRDSKHFMESFLKGKFFCSCGPHRTVTHARRTYRWQFTFKRSSELRHKNERK